MSDETPDFLSILRVLTDQQVDYIVVGALSAVLQGAPIMTFDLDLVHERSQSNIRRLQRALDKLDAKFRGHHERDLRPEPSHLRSEGHQLLVTRYGPLDLLGTIERGLGYGELVDETIQLDVDDFSVPVLRLEKYVELKRDSTRDKDRARLAILRQTLEEDDDSD